MSDVPPRRAHSWEARSADQWQQLLGVPAVHLFDVVQSTNDVALQLAESGADTLTLVVADHQTSGRGRGGSEWLSHPGFSLLCSVVFRTQFAESDAPGAAPIRIGWAVADAVSLLIDRTVALKWPNDVVIPPHGKIAGILCEGAFRQEGRGHIVAGIGINVFYPGAEYFSIADATDEPPTRAAVLQTLMRNLAAAAPRITAPFNDQEMNELRKIDVLFDQQVKTESGIIGRASGIAADGSLQIETTSGVETVRTATVRLADSDAYPGAYHS
jgi:BirA family transcriptional regulator, biotin operon repressor / biotin---[acetyl-CoA-carboxylase] ligase